MMFFNQKIDEKRAKESNRIHVKDDYLQQRKNEQKILIEEGLMASDKEQANQTKYNALRADIVSGAHNSNESLETYKIQNIKNRFYVTLQSVSLGVPKSNFNPKAPYKGEFTKIPGSPIEGGDFSEHIIPPYICFKKINRDQYEGLKNANEYNKCMNAINESPLMNSNQKEAAFLMNQAAYRSLFPNINIHE
ncbi:hypothetical protein [Pseudoalteromonas luteoviolacea]|uniref:hypothetical protein n=1 Tax=Pseudoalteromonas luteoviolacea TaxID=43657 RepID=UPI00114E37A8|nr:hypothetical protein [Pseudoalteromonas luteoviolacea]TQF70464.1 hypothetical protein FLM44_05050 [Pseudoalteromonas luteoviolacea]